MRGEKRRGEEKSGEVREYITNIAIIFIITYNVVTHIQPPQKLMVHPPTHSKLKQLISYFQKETIS